jgi:hypothetical protein
MSVSRERIHPDLCFEVAPPPQDEAFGSDGTATSRHSSVCLELGDRMEQDEVCDLAMRDLSPVPHLPFLFDKLPAHAQAKVFQYLLMKDGPVHCMSRLDPNRRPLEPLESLPRCFVWDTERLNLSEGREPNKVLALLLVCRRFYFIGVHCFYGLNTFAFSSLREFGRFCTGIGEARLDRVQHLELHLQGSQRILAPDQTEGNDNPYRYYSLRASTLTFLLDARRLKTLVST